MKFDGTESAMLVESNVFILDPVVRFVLKKNQVCYQGTLENKGLTNENVFFPVSDEEDGFADTNEESSDPTPTPTQSVTYDTVFFIDDDTEDTTDQSSTPTPTDLNCCNEISYFKCIQIEPGGSTDNIDSVDNVSGIGTQGKFCFSSVTGNFSAIPNSYRVSLETDDYSNGGFVINSHLEFSDSKFRFIKEETNICYEGNLSFEGDSGVNVFTQVV